MKKTRARRTKQKEIEAVKQVLESALLGPKTNAPTAAPYWNTIKPDDLKNGFKPASSSSMKKLMEKAARQQAAAESESFQLMTRKQRAQWQAEQEIKKAQKSDNQPHPFLNGNSPFIFYVIEVNQKKVAKKSKKLLPEMDLDKLPNEKKNKFVRKLKSNIDKTVDFLWEDVLPVTNALQTSIKRLDDYTRQVFDPDATSGVTVEMMRRKAMDAVNLRIIRHLGDIFDLNAEERQLFTAEFRVRIPGFIG